MDSGCGHPIAEKSFVCHSTPHFDSTLREVSYSVRPYHTGKLWKCKCFFANFLKKPIFRENKRKKPDFFLKKQWTFIILYVKMYVVEVGFYQKIPPKTSIRGTAAIILGGYNYAKM